MKYLWAVPVVVLIGAGVLTLILADSDDKDQPESLVNVSSPTSQVQDHSDSPFAVREGDGDASENSDELASSRQDAVPANEIPVQANPDVNVDVTALQPPLSEEELGLLVQHLKDNPALLQQLMDEFRQETNPERKQWLAGVLGEVGDEQVTLLASELIFSGDAASRSLGMSLLQDIQPGNAQARDIVSSMLATEIEPDVLVDALTALARPGDVDAQSRANLSDQVAWLTTHQDDTVRGISLDILSRWSDDARYTDVLLAGMDDASERVRTAAAYALVSHEDQSAAVVDRLFATVASADETTGVKRAAIRALNSMALTSAQQAELEVLEGRLNTVRR